MKKKSNVFKPDKARNTSKTNIQRVVFLQILMIFSDTVRVVIPFELSKISSNVPVLQRVNCSVDLCKNINTMIFFS